MSPQIFSKGLITDAVLEPIKETGTVVQTDSQPEQ